MAAESTRGEKRKGTSSEGGSESGEAGLGKKAKVLSVIIRKWWFFCVFWGVGFAWLEGGQALSRIDVAQSTMSLGKV